MQPPARRQRTTYDMAPQRELTLEEIEEQMDQSCEPSLAPTSPTDLLSTLSSLVSTTCCSTWTSGDRH